MKEKRMLLKKMVVCFLVGIMVLLTAVPASAATVYTKSRTITVKSGQSYHVLNNAIKTNSIRKYTVTVTKKSSDARYDLVVPGSDELRTYKNLTKTISITNSSATYLKSSTSADTGLICCIRVNKGSVQVKVTYETYNKSANLASKSMGSSHQTLKGVSVPVGKKVSFKQNGSNISKPSIIIAAQSGSVSRRGSSTTFENYTFGSSVLNYRYYKNGTLQKSSSLDKSYDTKYGGIGYIRVKLPSRSTGYFTSKIGTVNYFYPTDYVKMSFTVK
jgi:hypothetical protein